MGTSVDFVTAIKTVLGKYADFSGRARRSEYWFFYLAVVIGYVVSLIITQVVRPLGLLLLVLLVLGALIPTLACGVRRLHDTGKSGAFILFGLIPFVGGIILLVFFVMDSAPGDNQYGPNPKGIGGAPMGGYGQPPLGYPQPPVV